MDKKILYVFDLDGVITNPKDSRVNQDVLKRFHGLLVDGNPVAVNTGRSYEWVENNVVNYLETHNDPKLFERLIVVCEKGGEAITWHNDKAELTPSKFALPPADILKTKDIFETHRSELDTMFWDTTKRTMASIEKIPETSLEDFHVQQQRLKHYLASTLRNENIRVDATIIATDVESIAAGKYAGAEIIYEWSKAHSFDVNTCICFGDSVSDYTMATCFVDHNIDTTFVYVGKDSDNISIDDRVRFEHPSKKFDLGTLEYLGR